MKKFLNSIPQLAKTCTVQYIKTREMFNFLECSNKLSAHLAVRHPDVALPSVLITRYCIPQEWPGVQYQFVAQKFPLICPRKVFHNVNVYLMIMSAKN